jgi:hypothetical protein
MDINGKADPYLVLQLGPKRVSGRGGAESADFQNLPTPRFPFPPIRVEGNTVKSFQIHTENLRGPTVTLQSNIKRFLEPEKKCISTRQPLYGTVTHKCPHDTVVKIRNLTNSFSE